MSQVRKGTAENRFWSACPVPGFDIMTSTWMEVCLYGVVRSEREASEISDRSWISHVTKAKAKAVSDAGLPQ